MRRIALVVGCIGNLGALGYFKYCNFFLENINSLFHADFQLKNILLPLGISFFTFQQIGFLADAYKGEVGACSLREYVLFVSFFPYVSSGPIVNAQEMLPQYRQNRSAAPGLGKV